MPRSTPPQPRVLRVGIVQDGKVASERLLLPGESATIGSDPSCTFSLRDPHLPGQRPLFVARRGGRYQLQLSDDAALAIQRRGAITRHSGAQRLMLEDGDRGKITMGSVTVLFQFIDAPPIPADLKPGRFRPRLIDEDDPVFLGMLSTLSAAAAAMMIYVSAQPVTELVTFDEAREIIVQDFYIEADPVEAPADTLAVDDDAPPAPTPTTEPEPEPVADAEPAPEPAGGDGLSPAQREMQRALATQRRRKQVESQSALISSLLRSRNGDEDSVFRGADGLGDEWDRRIDAISSTSEDVAAAEPGAGIQGPRDRQASSYDGRISSDLQTGSGGDPDVTVTDTTAAAVPTGAVNLGPVDAPADAPQLRDGLKRYAYQVQSCYERRLKEVPNLEGRLVLGVVVEAGAVIEAYIDQNTTRDAELAACVTRQAMRWTLRGVDGAEALMPFSLTPGG